MRKCLDSCVNQDIPKDQYEIIAVNDGSPDNCQSILEEYEREYDNVRILKQENQGLSKARNNGLDIAKGDYVWFVDSDDWIEENCLSEIIAKLDNSPDILQIQYCNAYDNGKIQTVPITIWNGILDGRTLTKHGGLPEPAQFTIYNKKFLNTNNLRFYPGIYHEDCEFKFRCVWFASKCKSLDKVVYYYLQRTEGSISKNFKVKNAEDYLFVINRIIDFIREYQIEGRAKSALCAKIGIYLNMIFKGSSSLSLPDRKKIVDLLIQCTEYHRYLIQSVSIKHRFEGYMFKLSPRMCSTVMMRVYSIR